MLITFTFLFSFVHSLSFIIPSSLHVLSASSYQKSVEPSTSTLFSLSQTPGPEIPQVGATEATSWETQDLNGPQAVLSLSRGLQLMDSSLWPIIFHGPWPYDLGP